MKRLIVALALCSCAAPFQFTPPTTEAKERRAIASRLDTCRFRARNREDHRHCTRVSMYECREKGFASDCGVAELMLQADTSSSGAPGTVPTF